MTILIPLLVALLGVLAYALSSNGKIQEIGRICFFCGLFVTLFQIGGHQISLLR